MLMQFILLQLCCNFLKTFIVVALDGSISREFQTWLNITPQPWWQQENHKKFMCHIFCRKKQAPFLHQFYNLMYQIPFQKPCVCISKCKIFFIGIWGYRSIFSFQFVPMLDTPINFISLTPETKAVSNGNHHSNVLQYWSSQWTRHLEGGTQECYIFRKILR